MRIRSVKVLIMVLLVAVSLAACGDTIAPKEIIEEDLKLDISNAHAAVYSDSHGGFLGDGCTRIVMDFPDSYVAGQIEKSDDWDSLPNSTVSKILYEKNFFVDEDSHPLTPQIKNGYCLLIDRHSQKDKGIFDRHSYNFTLGVFDSDTNILYYFKLDT